MTSRISSWVREAARTISAPFVAPREIGPFHVDHVLGSGSEAVVYAAHDDNGNRVAIKVVPLERAIELRASTAAASAWFHASAAEAIGDVGLDEHAGVAFSVHRRVDGKPLHTVAPPLWVDARLRWVRQIFEVLATAHRAGRLHGDLSPTNILVHMRCRSATLVVVDWGSVVTLGTEGYRAPERGDGATPAADVYSAAVVALEILTGQRPSSFEHARALITPFLGDGRFGFFDFSHFPRPSVYHDAILKALVVALHPKPWRRPTASSILLILRFALKIHDLGRWLAVAMALGITGGVALIALGFHEAALLFFLVPFLAGLLQFPILDGEDAQGDKRPSTRNLEG